MRTPIEYAETFCAVLLRDLYVTGRDMWNFLGQVLLQPLFMLLIFGEVIIRLGFATEEYGDLLFPGMVALTAVLTGVQGTGMPLSIDFAAFREIEDRLLSPLPLSLVALEKVIFGVVRSMIAAIAVFPIGILVLGSVPFDSGSLPLLISILLLGAFLGSTIGLALGTLVPPNQVNFVFAVLMPPLLFTGCSQYPWPMLDQIRWLQVVSLFNPLTYVSEGVRAALLNDVPHLPPSLCLAMLVGAVVLFSVIGIYGFRRQALG
ncbi:ABC transporter permease [Nocardiopsis dassonvillei]|uniref:ABC transporter permease n=1 Tax=Nocardiopsis dassonvillei TaxID=2014 RepID=UPI0033F40907